MKRLSYRSLELCCIKRFFIGGLLQGGPKTEEPLQIGMKTEKPHVMAFKTANRENLQNRNTLTSKYMDPLLCEISQKGISLRHHCNKNLSCSVSE